MESMFGNGLGRNIDDTMNGDQMQLQKFWKKLSDVMEENRQLKEELRTRPPIYKPGDTISIKGNNAVILEVIGGAKLNVLMKNSAKMYTEVLDLSTDGWNIVKTGKVDTGVIDFLIGENSMEEYMKSIYERIK